MKNASSNTLLPRVAMIVALVFIAFGTLITISATSVHNKVQDTTLLINDVEHIEDIVTELAVAHRMERAALQNSWEKNRIELRDALGELELGEAFSSCTTMVSRALGHLEDMDELHREMGQLNGAPMGGLGAEFNRSAAGLSRQLDRMTFSLRNEHLSGGLAKLSTRWSYFEFLFLLACSLALLLAFMAHKQKELISLADKRADQLKGTTKELESTNIELRETMMSKEEKEMMLKEIHHRVKNNLQIIRSLIRFQAMKVTDPAIEELFNECVNRVSAMAVLHEQTYLSKDLANINVKDYLSMLVKDLTVAYNIDMQLEVETDIQIESLGVDTLMPIGLIINEIISNSLKYAFKDRSSGSIKVSMMPNTEGMLELKIMDNGVGIPNIKTWDNAETLGMELIKTLVDQLDGSVELNNGSGTEFDIQFPMVAA